MLTIRPIGLSEANVFVEKYHRHHTAARGNKFSIACYDGSRICGVAICGRPVARRLDDGMTLEILRNCTDGTRNACSKLYGACVKVARAMGYKRVITYTLMSENGASLKASNFTCEAENAGGTSWDTPARPRDCFQVDMFGEERKYPDELKRRWSVIL